LTSDAVQEQDFNQRNQGVDTKRIENYEGSEPAIAENITNYARVRMKSG
jgi:hypothetical protein